MGFVKLDSGILDSTLWMARAQREIFITALLMAEPRELATPMEQLEVNTLKTTGFIVPPGWYGFVPAAGVGIIARALVAQKEGLDALEALGSPESWSRSQDFEGRRLVRVDGGFIVLNFVKYRDKDYTTAERSRRYRERKKLRESQRDNVTSRRDITQALALAEASSSYKGLEPENNERVSKGDGLQKSPPENMPALNYAIKIIEELGMTNTMANKIVVEAAVKALVKSGKSGPAAYEFLTAHAKDAMEQGIPVDKFWFEDSKWRTNGNGRRPSRREQAFAEARRNCEETD